VAFFVDHGNAFDDNTARFSTGAGIGLRWQLPFAVFALDLAHPFDDRDGRSIRLHLNLGGEQ
jgi:translocation and assembly module TamA